MAGNATLTSWQIIVVSLLVINSGSFLLVELDKRRSRDAMQRRISEGSLFFLAILGGSAGVYLACLAFRHKTRRWYFSLGLPLLVLEQVALLYFVGHYLA